MQQSLQTIADLHADGDTEAEHVQHTFYEIKEAVTYESTLGEASFKAFLHRSQAFIRNSLTRPLRNCSPSTESVQLSL